MTSSLRSTARLAFLYGFLLSIGACKSMGARERGAVVGAAAGATVGGVVGNQTGSTARGALIGAVVGGAAGAVIGHQMDQQAKELQQQIPGATVERVGEGIQVTFASGLLYDFDSDVVREAAAENLRNMANSLSKYPNTVLLVVGHTDALGSATYNQDLATRRATSAARYLGAHGVAANRMRTSGRGELEPISANDTEYGRSLNRRIEIAIIANEAARSGAR